MSLWAVLPVKPLRQGKTRLSGVLTDNERYVLNLTLLGNTLNALRKVSLVQQILVVSRDAEVLSVSRDFGVRTFQEEHPSNLNQAVTLGVRFAVAGLAKGVLVLPADLPLLEPRHLQAIGDRFTGDNQLVIVPDRRDDGTNAMMIAPPTAVEFQFGPGSFRRHILAAEKQGLAVEIARVPGLSLDLDIPEDLDALRASILFQPQ